MPESTPDLPAFSPPRDAPQTSILAELAGADPRLVAIVELLLSENTQIKQSLEALRKDLDVATSLADRDPLCPVLNRRAFSRELDREISRAERHTRDLALLYIDLNNFKKINDEDGHEAGDKTLIQVAETLVANVRKTDIVARLGGDEFAVLLIETDGPSAQTCADILQQRFNDTLGGPVSASIGVAIWEPAMSANALIATADKAMFARKTARRKSR